MKFPKFSPKPKKHKPLLVRRIVGQSMEPEFLQDGWVLATSLFRSLEPGDVVIIRHDGLEKIKRVAGIESGKVQVLGDNPLHSTDSRHFGWLLQEAIVAKVFWPRP